MSLRGKEGNFNNTRFLMATSGFTMTASSWLKAETIISRDNPGGIHRSAIIIKNNGSTNVMIGAASGVSSEYMYPLSAGGTFSVDLREESGELGSDIYVYATGTADIRVVELF